MSVIFNDLRVAPDSTKLIIDVEVNKLPYFENTRIEGIYINTDRGYKESGVDLDNLVYEKHYTKEDSIKDVQLELVIRDLKDSHPNDLFFVYIKTIVVDEDDSTNTEGISSWSLGVTFDSNLLYQKSLMYLKDLGDTCHISKDLIDHILNYEMLKSSIETGHYIEAVRIFTRMFNKYDKCCPSVT